MFRNILVAVDGSDHATKALDIACDLAQRCSTRLIILSAYRHHSPLDGTHTLSRVRTQSNPPTSRWDDCPGNRGCSH